MSGESLDPISGIVYEDERGPIENVAAGNRGLLARVAEKPRCLECTDFLREDGTCANCDPEG